MIEKKLIIFDFADTIATLEPSKELLLQSFIFDQIAYEISIEKLSEVYHYINNIFFYSSVNIDKVKDKKYFYKVYNKKIFELLGISHLIDDSQYFDYVSKSEQHWKLKSGVQELLLKLKEDGYYLSLLSNFDSRLKNILKQLEIDYLFDSIFISQSENIEKPALDFFELPLKRHSVSAQQAYFIGDSYYLDFIPSNKLGMNSILLDEKNRYSHLDGKYIIKSLNNLIDRV